MPAARRLFVMAAGCGDGGRLGMGSLTAGALRFARVADAALASDGVASVAAGAAHSVALTTDGSVLTWGDNACGQLGHTPTAAAVALPREVLLPEAAVAVAAGDAHTLAVGASGAVWAWGRADGGALGLGTATATHGGPIFAPRRVVGMEGAASVAAGRSHSLALTHDGSLYSWGAAPSGALGHGEARGAPLEAAPRRVRTLGGVKVAAVSAGGDRSGALTRDGEAFEWGASVDGRPRRGDPPHPITGIPGALIALSTGRHHSAALRVGGRGVAWGDGGDHGALGTGAPTPGPPSPPAPIATPTLLTSIAVGWRHCAAVGVDGQLLTWGWGGSPGSEGVGSAGDAGGTGGGQLGSGDDLDIAIPTRVPGADIGGGGGREWVDAAAWRAVAVACGLNNTLAVVELL